MCGIAGILSLEPNAAVDPDALPTMADQLVHRGPDEPGTYLDPHRRCGLAFRRLAIIDLQGGHQPICNEDRTIWAVFNGEIYNFRELRTELQQLGHTFATNCDSEVIVHAYEQFGSDCFRRLQGMFAIAIWDQPCGQLTLARDRFGQKPLTYAIHNNRLYFASEAKAILALPEIPRHLDAQSLHRYLIFQYVPGPHSIYAGFRKLLPGYCVTFSAHRPADATPAPYWQLDPVPFAGTYADAQAQLAELLTAAVRKRLIADVPLGAFLSGGVDSSIVVALLRQLDVAPLRTFSIGFPDARYDETRHARLIADRFETEHHEEQVTPDARDILDTLAFHFDEPFADSSAIPTWYVSRHARRAVTVALTGDAGDECFAGYDRYRAASVAERLAILPQPLRAAFACVATILPHNRPRTFSNRLYRFAKALARPASRRYLSWVQIFDPDDLAANYRPEFADRITPAEPLEWFDHLYNSTPAPAANRAARADIASYLPYDLLTKVDRASMACSLECRCPFLDHELVEFATSLPISWRLGPAGGKRILKDWARSLLPESILNRPKMGFGVPVGAWFRGPLADDLRQSVLAPDSLPVAIFRPDWLQRLVDDHITGRANHEHPLWALLMLDRWHQRWNPTDIPNVRLS